MPTPVTLDGATTPSKPIANDKTPLDLFSAYDNSYKTTFKKITGKLSNDKPAQVQVKKEKRDESENKKDKLNQYGKIETSLRDMRATGA